MLVIWQYQTRKISNWHYLKGQILFSQNILKAQKHSKTKTQSGNISWECRTSRQQGSNNSWEWCTFPHRADHHGNPLKPRFQCEMRVRRDMPPTRKSQPSMRKPTRQHFKKKPFKADSNAKSASRESPKSPEQTRANFWKIRPGFEIGGVEYTFNCKNINARKYMGKQKIPVCHTSDL